MKIKKKCFSCHRDFETYKQEKKFCSIFCKYFGHSETKICMQCGKIFISEVSAGRKFCSHNCSAVYNNSRISKETRLKLAMSRLGHHLPLQTRYKISKIMRENNPFSKYVNLKKRIKRSLPYRLWKLEVLERDFFKCRQCGKTHHEIKLHAHHIIPLTNILEKYKIVTFEEAIQCEELFDANNGMTLCKTCHESTSNYFWKGSKYFKERHRHLLLRKGEKNG